MSDRKITEMAVELRNKSDEFDGRDSIDDVVEALLEQRLAELREAGKKAEEKREELRDKWGLFEEPGESDGSQSDVEAKQAELRSKMGLGQ